MKRLVSAIFLMALSPIASAVCVFAGEFEGHSYIKGLDYAENQDSFGDKIFKIETSAGIAAITPNDLFCVRATETQVWCDVSSSDQTDTVFEIWALDLESKAVIYTQNRNSTTIGALTGGKLMKGKILGSCD
jgi:predicted glycosyl hydrolase (DUF1957 family)